MPSGLGFHSGTSSLPQGRAWHAPDYRQEDPRKGAKKQLRGVKTLPELKERAHDYIPMHERPASVQHYAQEIAALQGEGTG